MWTEQASRAFIDYGPYFVPEHQIQIQTMVDLIPAVDEPFHVLELACGEGLLAEAILSSLAIHHLDGREKKEL